MSHVEGWNSRRGAESFRRIHRGVNFTTCSACGFNCGAPPEAVVDGRPFHDRCKPVEEARS